MIEAALEPAYAHCADVARRSESSFLAAFWLFPREQRRALHAVYAFCRLADDIADDPEVKSDRGLLLHRWRGVLEDAYLQKSRHPVGVALGDAVHRFHLKKDWFEALLDGVEADLRGEPIEHFEELERYCYRVASTVGLMVLGLRGARGPQIEDYALHLGIGVQLTNILRDVRADAAEGRIYFARKDLAYFGVSPEALGRRRLEPDAIRLLADYAVRARFHYERSQQVLPPARRDALRPAQAMGAIYRDLLTRLEGHAFRDLDTPVRSSKARRLVVAARSWVTGELA